MSIELIKSSEDFQKSLGRSGLVVSTVINWHFLKLRSDSFDDLLAVMERYNLVLLTMED